MLRQKLQLRKKKGIFTQNIVPQVQEIHECFRINSVLHRLDIIIGLL